MQKKLMFNTLGYAKMLRKGGVSLADTHAAALDYALQQNLYTKTEVREMLELALDKVSKSIQHLDNKIDRSANRLDHKIDVSISMFDTKLDGAVSKLDSKIDKSNDKMQKNTITTISVLGALVVLVGALSAFFHNF